jgi:hypothetical protein
MTGRHPAPDTTDKIAGRRTTWISAAQQERREQSGRFLLGTGGIAGATGPGPGLSDSEGLGLIDRAVEEEFKVLDAADMYTGGNSEPVVGTWNRAHPLSAAQGRHLRLAVPNTVGRRFKSRSIISDELPGGT